MMSFAKPKKQSPDNAHRQRHDDVRNAVRNSQTLYSNPQAPTVQRKPVCPCGGGCPRCAEVIRPKLTIGQPNDIYEQEADRIAEQVMRMPENIAMSHRSSAVNKLNESVQTKPA